MSVLFLTRIKTAPSWGLLSLYIALAFLSPLSLRNRNMNSSLEARPPSVSPQRADDPSNKRASSLESINQSWLAEIQKRSANSAGTANSVNKAGTQAKAPHSEKKLYLANPGSAKPESQLSPEKAEIEAEAEASESNPGPDPDLQTELSQAAAKSKEEQRALPQKEAPSFSSAALRFILFLSLLGLLLYFGLRFFRSRNQGLFHRGGDLVQLLVSVPLVQGKFLQIVDVAGQLLVLGVSDAGVQLLTNVSEGISADRIRLWQSRQGPELPPNNMLDKLTAIIKGSDLSFLSTQTKQNFASVLKQFSGQPTNKKTEEEGSDKAAELKRLLLRQKRELSKKNS